MNKLVSILLLSFFVFSGCGTTMKQQWYDFNAYYNTFYNANQYFEAGLEENRRQTAEINPNDLIRIHPPPATGGADYFAQAIEKSSDILRAHYRSKYVDDAIELIGISYFYRQEYFAAQEKFQELYYSTNDPGRQAAATIWEGRTYIELQLYNEGVRFMEARLDTHDDWSASELAEARAVLSQLYTYQGNLYHAGNQLLLALDDFEGDELRPRAWFHYGQIMERIGNLDQAEYVFREIGKMRTSFDLEYQAQLKEIGIYRQKRQFQEAENRLRTMARDDRYYDSRPEIRYELARTEMATGDLLEARDGFNSVIHSVTAVPPEDLAARSYYELANLYRSGFGDYETASAYYDSAAAVQADRERLPEYWDADEMARVFGEYASVRQQIKHLDSLITLGRLPEEELQLRIEEIEEHLRSEQEAESIESEGMEAALYMTMPDTLESTTEETDRYGFLNINDTPRLVQSSRRFLLMWNNRPLADDWRRREAIPESRQELQEQEAVIKPDQIIPEEEMDFETAPHFQVDVTEIPVDQADRDSMNTRIYQNYFRLGNIYLTNMNMPDSARVYFERVYREGPEGAPKASSLYALADVALQEGDEEEAVVWARKLITRYPGSRQASHIARRLELSLPDTEEPEGGDSEDADFR